MNMKPSWTEVLPRVAALASHPNSNAQTEQWADNLLFKIADFLDKHPDEFPMIPPGEYFQNFYGMKPQRKRGTPQCA